MRRFKFSRVLSDMCSRPEISEIICLTEPQYADLCCQATCPEGNNQCEKWDVDAFSSNTGKQLSLIQEGYYVVSFRFAVEN